MTERLAVIQVPIQEWDSLMLTVRELKESITKLQAAKPEKELLTIDEACSELGITRSTFERYKKDGLITVSSKGKGCKGFVHRSELNNFISKMNEA